MEKDIEVDGAYDCIVINWVGDTGICDYTGWLTPDHTDDLGRPHGNKFHLWVADKIKRSRLVMEKVEHGAPTSTKTIAELSRVVSPSEISDILREYELIKTPKQDEPPRTSGGRKL